MTRTMRMALMALNFMATLVELYAQSTEDERDDKAAAQLRAAVDGFSEILTGG